MDFSALETAIFLAKITDDPLYKSAIRTISDPESPQKAWTQPRNSSKVAGKRT